MLGVFALARTAADYRAYASPFDRIDPAEENLVGFLPLLSVGEHGLRSWAPEPGPRLDQPDLFASRLMAADKPAGPGLENAAEGLRASGLVPAASFDPETLLPGFAVEAGLKKPAAFQPAAAGRIWIPEQISIPALDLVAPILPVGAREIEYKRALFQQWVAPDQFAAGWHNTSAALGMPGNTVLNGHHNAFGEVFRELHTLENGDLIFISSGERVFAYQIGLTMRLNERFESVENRLANAQWIRPSNDERITLVSCWPYESNTHRVIVVAVPVDLPAGEAPATGKSAPP